MSSTNRGATRRAADYYPTPHWRVDRLLKRIGPQLRRLHPAVWIEPCVGDGAIMRAVNNARGQERPFWLANDVRDVRAILDPHLEGLGCEDACEWLAAYDLGGVL